MADVTDAPVPTGSSEFDIPGDLGRLADHFGDGNMFAVANAAALPSTDNWVGRMLTTSDNGNLYRWLGSAWFLMPRVRRGLVGSPAQTDINGYVVTAHGLGMTPSAVQVTDRQIGLGIETRKLVVQDIDATNFVVRYYNGGAAFGTNPIGFSWMVAS
jgi:hypothetical protein